MNDNQITDVDHAVHNLEMTQASLLKQLETLEDDIKANDDKARQYVRENKRQLAKTYLRKRRLLEKNHGVNQLSNCQRSFTNCILMFVD